MFCQIIDLLKFINFKKIVKDLNADRYIKGISNWAHLITMLFVQISGASSLRDGINGLACEGGALSHLGIQSIPSKSGLSYANATRNPELFEKVFQQLYSILAPRIPKSDLNIFKFKNKLFSIDSTLIALCMELFDWAYYKTSKGAVKIHLVLEHNSYLPYYALVSEGKVADIHAAEVMPFPKKSILVMDRGYVKLTFFDYLDENECFFVTRLKDNLQYKVVSSLPLSNPVGRPRKKPDTTVDSSKPRITADQRIIFTGPGSYEKYPKEIRLVTALVPNLRDKKGELYEMKFLTNNFNLSAATISAIYRNRWMVESFFQAIKQNLRIKTFLGTSKNAVKIQIFSALIAMLLITYLKGASTTEWSLSGMLYLIR
jgi:hypothetical protein